MKQKFEKKLVKIYISIPEGATHYTGEIDNCPSLYKCESINDIPYWYRYSRVLSDWEFWTNNDITHYLAPLSEIILDED